MPETTLTESLKYNIRLLKLVGAWKINSFGYNIYKFSLTAATFLLYVFIIIEVALRLAKGHQIENFYTLFGELESPIKLLFFWSNTGNIQKGLEIFQGRCFQGTGKSQGKILSDAVAVSKGLQICYYTLTTFAVFVIILSPSLYEKEAKMFILVWIPFDYGRNALSFSLVFGYVAICCFICAYINVATDCFLYVSCIQISAQFDCISHTLKNLENVTKIQADVALKACIEHYEEVLKFIDSLHEAYKGIMTVQVAFSTMSLCVTLYQMSLEKSLTSMLVSMILYLTTMTFEIFCYCYFSQQVTNKSLEVFQATFECGWYKFSGKFQKDLLVFMDRVRSPVVFFAWNILPIDLETFKKITQKSWAFFIALKNTQ